MQANLILGSHFGSPDVQAEAKILEERRAQRVVMSMLIRGGGLNGNLMSKVWLKDRSAGPAWRFNTEEQYWAWKEWRLIPDYDTCQHYEVDTDELRDNLVKRRTPEEFAEMMCQDCEEDFAHLKSLGRPREDWIEILIQQNKFSPIPIYWRQAIACMRDLYAERLTQWESAHGAE